MDELYRIAQEVTDKVMGKGAYKKLNKFDPSKGETSPVIRRNGDTIPMLRKKRKTRLNP